MSPWIVIAVLTLAVMATLAWPLLRARGRRPVEDPTRAVFRHQLDEISGEVERGLITAEEASAMQAEIGRRMLETAKGEEDAASPAAGSRRMRWAGVAIVIFLPGAAIGLYAQLGAPQMPDQPLASRSMELEKAAKQKAEVSAIVQRLTARLARQPDNLEAWLLLARSHGAMGNQAGAATALARAHALADGDAAIAASYGEAQILADGGAFSAAARAAFAKARAWDRLEPKSLFYQGLDWAQRGEHGKALQAWINLVNISPPNAPWMITVRQQIAASAKAAGIDPTSIKPTLFAPARQAAPGERRQPLSDGQIQTIQAMVQRLADRLKVEPDDLKGWRMLARSYRVLGEVEKARQAEARLEQLRDAGSKP